MVGARSRLAQKWSGGGRGVSPGAAPRVVRPGSGLGNACVLAALVLAVAVEPSRGARPEPGLDGDTNVALAVRAGQTFDTVQDGAIPDGRRLPLQAVLELAQATGGDVMVPPVKREKPVTPAPAATQDAAPKSEPETIPAAAPAATGETPREAQRPVEAAPVAAEQAPAGDANGAKEKTDTKSAGKQPPSMPDLSGLFAPLTEWLAKSNREYQGTVIKELSRPAPADGDAEARRLAAEKAKQQEAAEKAEAARQADVAKQQAAAKAAEDARRRAAEAEAAKRQAEVAKQAAVPKAPETAPTETKPADTADKAEAAKKADAAKAEEARKSAEAEKAEAARKAAEAQTAAEAQKAEAAKKAAENAEEARRLKEAARAAEERRKHDLAKAEEARKERARLAQEDRAAREAAQVQDQRAKLEADREREASKTAAGRPASQPAPVAAARETAGDNQRHRRWTVTISTEPIRRPRTEPVSGRMETASYDGPDDSGVLVAARRLQPRMRLGGVVHQGTAVKRWAWRTTTCRYAGRKITPPRKYTVAKGDSLWRISEVHYDNGKRYTKIYRANRDKISDPDRIYPCQRFRMPRR